MKTHLHGERQYHVRLTALVLVIAPVLGATARSAGLQIKGVQPYALDQPRGPALLRPAGGGPPLSAYSQLLGQKLFAFNCFLDTGSSRVVLSKSDRDVLKVQGSGRTVEDWGIGGTETFDASIPYRLCVGDSATDITAPQDFPFRMRCRLELRRSDRNPLNVLPRSLTEPLTGGMGRLGLGREEIGQMLAPSINIVGTPFLKNHVAVLDPRPVADALEVFGALSGGDSSRAGRDPFAALDDLLEKMQESGSRGLSFGRIKVDILRATRRYRPPQLIVPLKMKDLEPERVPVTAAKMPFLRDVTLRQADRKVKLDLLLDTGGAVSLISPAVAHRLGLDAGPPQVSAPIQGVGKDASPLKGYWLDRMEVPLEEGDTLTFSRVPVFVADVPGIEGSVGANMLVPSVYINMDMEKLRRNPMSILNSMEVGAIPFRRIVLDLPRRRLGLDPAPVPRAGKQGAGRRPAARNNGGLRNAADIGSESGEDPAMQSAPDR